MLRFLSPTKLISSIAGKFVTLVKMKCHSLTITLLPGLLFQYISATSNTTTSGIRNIFLFKDVMESNTVSLTTSGFNTLVIFNIGIIDNGDIVYYSNTAGSKDALVASNGTYVGGVSLANKVLSFKSGNITGISRVEISMNSQHVRDLMRNPGPGNTTNLYRNFEALRIAWNLDAMNNDDESLYDVASTVAFCTDGWDDRVQLHHLAIHQYSLLGQCQDATE
jgi:hypothetical protein